MNYKIEEGMYVRTKKGIAKVTMLCDLDNVAWTDNKDIYFGINRPKGYLHFEVYDDGTVIGKPSFNILDLIELGDYVNGVDINYRDENGVYHGANDAWDEAHFTDPKDVHDIVTKEQFEAMKYKIGE